MNAAVSAKAPGSIVASLIDANAPGYAGDVTPQQAFECLINESAVLIDVRTLPEWQFTGVPDLRAHGVQTHLISWKTYPHFQMNPDFAAQVEAIVPDKATPIFFICRSGGRSADAAIAMTQAGYTTCFNVSGGFEGEPDATGKRGIKDGWKACGLSWSQQ